MSINRFYKPAQMTNVFQPFQLPFDAMAQTIAMAQQQQDASREGLFNILDTDFNYLSLPSNQKAYTAIKQSIEDDVNSIIAKSENGDLRGLKTDILNSTRNLKKRMTSQDGDIFKLVQGYAAAQKWKEDNKDIEKTDPYYFNYAFSKELERIEQAGGNLNTPFSQELLLQQPNWSEVIDKFGDNIQADIIKKANKNTNGFIYNNYEEAIKHVSQDEVFAIVSGYASSSPSIINYMQQAGRLGYYDKDQLPIAVPKTVKDKKGKDITIYEPNVNYPGYGAIAAAMNKYSFIEQETKTESGYDSGAIAYAKYMDEKQKIVAPVITDAFLDPAQEGDFSNFTLTAVDRIKELIDSGNYAEAKNQMEFLRNNEGVKSGVIKLKNDKSFKEYYDQNKEKLKDRKGKIPTFDQFLETMVMTNGSFDGVVNTLTDPVQSSVQAVLEGMGYDYRNTWILNNLFGGIATQTSALRNMVNKANNILTSKEDKHTYTTRPIAPPVFVVTDPNYKNIEKSIISSGGKGLYNYSTGQPIKDLTTTLGEIVSIDPAVSYQNGNGLFLVKFKKEDEDGNVSYNQIYATPSNINKVESSTYNNLHNLGINAAAKDPNNQGYIIGADALRNYESRVPKTIYTNKPLSVPLYTNVRNGNNSQLSKYEIKFVPKYNDQTDSYIFTPQSSSTLPLTPQQINQFTFDINDRRDLSLKIQLLEQMLQQKYK